LNQNEDIYRKLQRHIDSNMPVSFPETESGVEISILKQLFSPEEAEVALEISSAPEPARRIHKRLKKKIPHDELQEILNRLVEKGAIVGPAYYRNLGMGTRYGKAPFIVGMYEFQASRLTEEFEKYARQYIDEKYNEEVLRRKITQMRTIPISRSITPVNHVDSYDNVKDLVTTTKHPIVVLTCICREGSDLLNESCQTTSMRETCLLLNENASMYIDLGRGRPVSKEEALEILDRAEADGLVLQPANSRNPGFICCCCGCCCGMLVNLKKAPQPAQYFQSNFYSEVNADSCLACSECVEICPMDAISIEDNIAVSDPDRCIGCGVCMPACSNNAITLQNKKRKNVPPKNVLSMYRKLFMERYGISGMLRMMGMVILGRKL